MPVRYVCSRCGYVIFEFRHVGQTTFGLPSPADLARIVGDRCPNCGKALSVSPSIEDIEVR